MVSSDPLLEPFQLKHLTLRNRLMITSHEPAYTDDGMPKERYRLYHEARAKGGVALTMTAGSALVSRDSPPAFGNILQSGNDLTISSWDIIAGDVLAKGDVMLYDDGAYHTGIQAAEVIAKSGAQLEYVSPERSISPDIGGVNVSPYIETLLPFDVRFSLCRRALSATREGDKIRVVLGSDYGEVKTERIVNQLVVEHGAVALDDVYYTLKPLSINYGEVDHDALINCKPQNIRRNPEGRFQLFRIGDAVSSRNVHAAIYDALRLVKEI